MPKADIAGCSMAVKAWGCWTWAKGTQGNLWQVLCYLDKVKFIHNMWAKLIISSRWRRPSNLTICVLEKLSKKTKHGYLDATGRAFVILGNIFLYLITIIIVQVLKLIVMLFDFNTHDIVKTGVFFVVMNTGTWNLTDRVKAGWQKLRGGTGGPWGNTHKLRGKHDDLLGT